jgi:hypothetical protein
MISGAAFDLYKPLLTAAKVADLCGVQRPVIDTMGTRGFIHASGREQSSTQQQGGKKGAKSSGPKGRPLFSARDVFKVRLMRDLADQVDFALTQSKDMAVWTEKTSEDDQKKLTDYEASVSKLADAFAYEGEWMWGMARSIERGKPFYIYAYATRAGGKWRFDMHIETTEDKSKPNEPPRFGWDVPHIYVPVGKIFSAVYDDCKKLLGITADEGRKQ